MSEKRQSWTQWKKKDPRKTGIKGFKLARLLFGTLNFYFLPAYFELDAAERKYIP